MADPPRPTDRLLYDAVVARLRSAGCVFAEDEAGLLLAAAGSPEELESLVRRRVAGSPLETLLGWARFCGLRIILEPGVFVPRRRTEFLAERAIALVEPETVVVDLCCGCGAVGAAILAAHPGVQLYAVDLDPVAVRCARRNLVPAGGEVFEGDLYAALPDELQGTIGVLVANAPYVPTAAIAMMPPEARDHEAKLALDGGADGLDVQRRVIAEAPRWLGPGGHLLVETSRHQVPHTAAIFDRVGLNPRIVRSKKLDATVVIGTKSPPTEAA